MIMTNFSGGIADDATLIVAKKTREQLQTRLEDNLEAVTDFLESNQLVINQSKTTITESMVKQKQVWQTEQQPELSVTDEHGDEIIISQTREIRIIGGNLRENLSWSSHLLTGGKATIASVRRLL